MIFNFDTKEHIDKLLVYAEKLFPGGPYFFDITHWDDGDFRVELVHSEGVNVDLTRHKFSFSSSKKEYKYEVQKNITCASSTTISKRILDI